MTGGTPDDAESARCLFEFRGGIEEYCKAAARLVARPHGIFIVVETAQAVERTYAAAAAAGLRVLARVDIVPREGKPVLINVFVMAASPAYEVEAPPAAPGLEGAAVTWIPPNTFAPDGRGPYDVKGSTEAALSATPAAGGASSADSSVTPAATAVAAAAAEEGGPAGAEAAAPPDEGGASSAAAPAAAASAAPQGPKRKRAQVQPGKPMPAAQPGELVVSIPVRDARGERTLPYRLLLQELGKPG